MSANRAERLPCASAASPVLMPISYRRCLSGEESITPAAQRRPQSISQTLGANRHEGSARISRKSVHHGVGLFDEVDLHPAQQAFAEHVDLFHDPGQRQHRNIFVLGPLGSNVRYVAQCRSTRPAANIASFGWAVVPEVVQRNRNVPRPRLRRTSLS